MLDRHAYALQHPLNRADNLQALRALTATRRHGTGMLVQTILAVDR